MCANLARGVRLAERKAIGGSLYSHNPIMDGGEVELENSWTFWHDKYIAAGNEKEYKAALTQLVQFNTVQGFWSAFNNLPAPQRLEVKSSLHMMKTGIKPLW